MNPDALDRQLTTYAVAQPTGRVSRYGWPTAREKRKRRRHRAAQLTKNRTSRPTNETENQQ